MRQAISGCGMKSKEDLVKNLLKESQNRYLIGYYLISFNTYSNNVNFGFCIIEKNQLISNSYYF